MTIWGDLVVAADADGYLHLLALDDGRTVGRFSLDAPLEVPPLSRMACCLRKLAVARSMPLRTN